MAKDHAFVITEERNTNSILGFQNDEGSIIYYHKGGGRLLKFGGHIMLGDKKGAQKIFSVKEGIEDFHKKDFLLFILRLC